MQTIKSKDLSKDCYGLARQQKQGSCWIDSTFEVFLNSDTLGELVRSEMFEYGLYKGRVVPYKVTQNVIVKNKYQSFLIYIIFNFILFNLEITNVPDFVKIISPKKISLERQASFDRCETSLEHFMDLIKELLFKHSSKNFLLLNPSVSAKIEPGGSTILLIEKLFKYIPNINTYIKSTEYYPPFKKPFNRETFLGASLCITGIKHKKQISHAVSILKCNNKIYYYDNNIPIDPIKLKRSIDISEYTDSDGNVVERDDFVDNFWENQVKFISHYCDYFTTGAKFGYSNKVRTHIDNMFTCIITYDEINSYNKNINLTELNGDSLKNILYTNLISTVEQIIKEDFIEKPEMQIVMRKIVNLFCEYLNFIQPYDFTPTQPDDSIHKSSEVSTSIIQDTIQFVDIIKGDDITEPQVKTTLPEEKAYYKYLKYKYKYLASIKKIYG